MKRTRTKTDLAAQMKKVAKKEVEKKKEYDGNTDIMISTGSTLLDLAISGGRVRGGGLPGGILVEVFGPSGSGKTVLLSEIAGAVQRRGGEIMFNDPEARLNKTFAQLFDLDTDTIEYNTPNTVTEVFTAVREWQPESKQINGVFTDSLAALSTDLEMDNKDGDKMGMRRAKEFSEELRKVCRILTKNNLLMVCSNQIRESADAGMYSEKTTSPGGKAIGFYASVRLRTKNPKKIKETVRVAGKEVQRVIGVEVEFEVYKNSVWKPYRTAPLVILFDYGIDDVRTNLQFIKDHTKNNVYTVKDITLDKSMNVSIRMVEEQNLEKKLRRQVIDLWESIEAMFDSNRKRKER